MEDGFEKGIVFPDLWKRELLIIHSVNFVKDRIVVKIYYEVGLMNFIFIIVEIVFGDSINYN